MAFDKRISPNVVVLVVLLAAAITPTLLVRIPAMEDYLDHLARMYILTTAGTEHANPYYQVSWALYPDLAVDIVVPQLARFMTVETAGRIFVLMSQLLIITGAIALELSVKGRHELAGFAALLTIPSMPFSLGLVNFEFGTGISLLGIASWIALSREDKPALRFSVHAIFVGILFVSHFFALGIYGLTIGLFELRRIFNSRFRPKDIFVTAIALSSPAIFLLLLMSYTGATVGESDNIWWLSWKPVWLALFLNGYSIPSAVGSAAVLTILLIYLRLKRSISFSNDGRWIAAGFLFMFLAIPFKLFGSRLADIRMITATFLILPAFTTFSPKTRSLGYLANSIIAAIIILNISYASYIWLSYQRDYSAIKASFKLLPRGSFILVGSNDTKDMGSTVLTDAPMSRAPTLAVYYANAFVSSLYTIPGTHAVEVRSELKYLDVNNKTETYAPPSLSTLRLIAGGGNSPNAPMYIRNWTSDFDYVYLLGPQHADVLPDKLEEMYSSRRFTLYRVRK
jgi:hypothetical protein